MKITTFDILYNSTWKLLLHKTFYSKQWLPGLSNWRTIQRERLHWKQLNLKRLVGRNSEIHYSYEVQKVARTKWNDPQVNRNAVMVFMLLLGRLCGYFYGKDFIFGWCFDCFMRRNSLKGFDRKWPRCL